MCPLTPPPLLRFPPVCHPIWSAVGGDGAHEQVGAEHVVGAVEVARYAALQVFGLADVDHRALGVVVGVDAGRFG